MAYAKVFCCDFTIFLLFLYTRPRFLSAQMLELAKQGARWLRDYEGWGSRTNALVVEEGSEPPELIRYLEQGENEERKVSRLALVLLRDTLVAVPFFVRDYGRRGYCWRSPFLNLRLIGSSTVVSACVVLPRYGRPCPSDCCHIAGADFYFYFHYFYFYFISTLIFLIFLIFFLFLYFIVPIVLGCVADASDVGPSACTSLPHYYNRVDRRNMTLKRTPNTIYFRMCT